ncbi:ATP-binding protein [Polyangium sp. y55x31]|uniref:sensor histidine kinase n=1 Tax=Polyangium sp. y55x31 TaxID=3042688 RepID=UPI0024825C98|nr:ATP-binding protein [Polyangium sp. y55x31]MDI1483967.1 ATP-binding protein [Polyangium sp. y55x31]
MSAAPNPPRPAPLIKRRKIERRVVLAVLVTAVIPLVAALLMARAMVARVSATAFQPEFGAHLDRALGVYADLAKTIKQGMRYEADAIAMRPELSRVAKDGEGDRVSAELAREFSAHPSLVSLKIEDASGKVLGKHERERPVDPAAERTLLVRRPLGETSEDDGPFLVATFAAPNARFAEMESAQEFVQAYHQLERHHREEYVDRTYTRAFGLLFGLLILLAALAGIVVARPVTRRIAELAAATRPVAAGDLTVRVAVTGDDEVGDLGRAFNRMLAELDESRARIEFLRRMSEWQKMARHLAHEIKNPLTPIQLAVQECHRRYAGDDPDYRRIVQTTLEVVEEEVGTLRRLVGEFSSFARLPRAELSPVDLGAFMREQRDHFSARTEGRASSDELALLSRVDLRFDVPEDAMPVVLDREMLHRVLTNVVQNAAQALRDARKRAGKSEGTWGRVVVSLRTVGGSYVVDVDDDGPGISAEVRDVLFDPYVTTKRDGTGLGLTIVKKIVVDHGGTIEATASPLGGARFRIRLPRADSAEARAAVERSLAADDEEGARSSSAGA